MIALLRDQAWIDALTGLKNRAALDDALDAAAAAYERVGQPAALLLIDLDHFKRVNDEYGHGVGDELLRGVGAAIRASCRPYDTPARFGGDEFAVVFTQTEGEGARIAADRVLASVRNVVPAGGSGAVRARCSAGLCSTASGGDNFTAADLVKAADAALYEAKRAGGARLVARSLRS
jgi:diguanylate cyclase (GGDEF)-like protein